MKLSDMFPFQWMGTNFELEIAHPMTMPRSVTLGAGDLKGVGAVVCLDADPDRGPWVVVKEDSWDYAYDVSHEIAEYLHDFNHTPQMFAEQANILAVWLRRR